MNASAKIGVIVLTYNSASDLPACLDGLFRQRGSDIRIIVVDNASAPESRAAMEAAFLERAPDAPVIDAAAASPTMIENNRAVFIRNSLNAGYSAGNNIGARLAVGAGCEAVLIVNPDVRIDDPDYITTLWAEMKPIEDCLVGASKVIDIDGRDQHPLRENRYWEELFWVRQLGPRRFRPRPWVEPPVGVEPVEAEKVHGCCVMIRSSFLEATGFLDESVFLYCEEPILAARVRAAGGRLMVFPRSQALHAHIAATKGNSSRRMLLLIKSRLYYLETYSGYGFIKLMALRGSYALLALLHYIKARYEPS